MIALFLRAFEIKDRARPMSAGGTLRLVAQIAVALSDRIKVLETARSIPFKGVWQPTSTYAMGDFVMSSGSMFCAMEASKGRKPSDDPTVWRMASRQAGMART